MITLTNLHSFDSKIIVLTQKLQHPLLTFIFKILTFSGTTKAWFSFAFILFILIPFKLKIFNEQNYLLLAMIAPLLSWPLSSYIKKSVARKRPIHSEIRNLKPLILTPTCGSFPSSHTSSTISFAMTLLLISHPLAKILLVWSILVSFSRLYLGVHFLTDLLGGALIGIITAFLTFFIFQNFIF